MFTDKAKEKFKEWLKLQPLSVPDIERALCIYPTTILLFDQLPPSMQWGVIQDFADSLGIYITIDFYGESIPDEIKFQYTFDCYGEYEVKPNKIDYAEIGFKTRQEARTEAIKKLNELINS